MSEDKFRACRDNKNEVAHSVRLCTEVRPAVIISGNVIVSILKELPVVLWSMK
jgi:hypothetical protein